MSEQEESMVSYWSGAEGLGTPWGATGWVLKSRSSWRWNPTGDGCCTRYSWWRSLGPVCAGRLRPPSTSDSQPTGLLLPLRAGLTLTVTYKCVLLISSVYVSPNRQSKRAVTGSRETNFLSHFQVALQLNYLTNVSLIFSNYAQNKRFDNFS